MSIPSTGLSGHETPRASGRINGARGAPMERRTYSLDEVAMLLGISRNTTYVAARADKLPVPVIRIGRRMLVAKAALDRFLDPGETEAA